MSQQVLIIGNSGAARECYWTVQELSKTRSDLSFKGFLAFEGYPGDLQDLQYLNLGSDDNYDPCSQDVFIIGVGQASLRQRIYLKWKTRGANFINLVHPTCFISAPLDLGEANILGYGSCFSNCVKIGHANFFNGRILVGHDVIIGDANFFGPDTTVLGGATIGSLNSFGVRSTIMAKATIGDNNTLAPGAYLYKGCKNNCFMAGNPAITLKSNDHPTT